MNGEHSNAPAPVTTETVTWEVSTVQEHPDDFPFLQIHQGGVEVAHVYHHPDEYPVAERNARLIAAAPDLLSALKALMPEGDGWYDGTMDHMPGVKLARLAIAKAEGRS